MKLFECQNCRNAVHFSNNTCLNCGFRLGYLPEKTTLSALAPDDGGWKPLAEPSRRYFLCENAANDACNWLVAEDSGTTVCEACRFNHMVPDLTQPRNLELWQKIELAKHQVFYSLLRWKLPMKDRTEDPEGGLAFDFLSDDATPATEHILTGHDNGLITLNIAEADDAEREKRRTSMGEPYRTLIGHFRHELGHYFWDLLVRDGGKLDACRAVFGDERADYGDALKAHYENGAPANWQDSFISSYATAHPWEDFAETWAHYLHMVDGLETAASFGIKVRPKVRKASELEVEVDFDPYRAHDAQELVDAWVPLTVALNSVNRSMGQPDLYPFVLSAPVVQKMQFIHELVTEAPARAAAQNQAAA